MLALAKDCTLEILEGYHDHSDIVEGLPIKGIFQNGFNRKTTLLMHILSKLLIFVVYVHAVPYAVRHILIRELVKYAITT